MAEIIIIVCCLICSAFFSASETAYSSLNRNRLKLMAEGGKKRATLALKLYDGYDSLLSSILVGNNIVNIALASVATVLFVRLMGNAGASVSTAAVTVAVLIFGEVTPKSIAKDHPESFAIFSAPLLSAVVFILKPINFLFSAWKKLIGKIFGSGKTEKVTQEELLLMLEEVEKEGTIDRGEGELLANALEFAESTAEEVLTHRTEMRAVSVTAEKEKIAEVFSESGFSRLPVYRDSLDDIVGILHQKDFFTAAGLSPKPVEELMKQPVFVNGSEKIDDVLRLMKRQKTHLCIVVDEYGGTSGLITMEDILEELVGDILDEHDEETQNIVPDPEGGYLVSGLTELKEFSEFFGVEPDSDNISVGGWVTEFLGRIPDVGDGFKYDKVNITVAETDGRRVLKIKVFLSEEAEGEKEDEN